MSHNGTLNNRINKLQERALRLVLNNSTSSFYELLLKDNSLTIHHRNMQKLALEMYRAKHRIAPKTMCELFNNVRITLGNTQKVQEICGHFYMQNDMGNPFLAFFLLN